MPAVEPALRSYSHDDISKIFASLGGAGHIALAVSGGSDSMALLRLAKDWAEVPLTVLTVDHGLRPASPGEAAKVEGWAAQLGLACQILRWEGPKPATAIQAKARDARYRLLLGWCRENRASHLLTAHTVEDQAETVLMRLARTSSLDSLAGIAPSRQSEGVWINRPLLGETRARLRYHLGSLGQEWIEDPSNDDLRFERVRIRQAIAEIGISVAALAHLADEARSAAADLWACAHSFLKAETRHYDEGYGTVATAALAGLGPDLRGRALGLLVRRYGAGAVPEPHERALLALWLEAEGAPRRTLGGAVLARRKSILVVGREPGRIDPRSVAVPDSGKLLWDGRFDIRARPGSTVMPGARQSSSRRSDLPAFVQAALPIAQYRGRRLDAGEWSLIFVTR